MKRTHDISNSDDVIDSRDVIARIEAMQEEREEIAERCSTEDDSDEARAACLEAQEELAGWDEDSGDELKALLVLQEEAEGYSEDWTHGSQLIRDSYFVESMQELCADIGDLPKEIPSYVVIDWDATAENLKADYTSVDFDGVTYWIR